MSRALSRSLAVVALLAVVSAALVVVTPSLARLSGGGRARHAGQPTWLWESHVYGGTTAGTPGAKPRPTPHAARSRRPYKAPVDRWSQP